MPRSTHDPSQARLTATAGRIACAAVAALAAASGLAAQTARTESYGDAMRASWARTVTAARSLAGTQPAAVWQDMTVQGEFADYVGFVDDDRVVVSTVVHNMYGWPIQRLFGLSDLRTRTVRWGSAIPWTPWVAALPLAGNIIVCAGRPVVKLTARDTASGARRWEYGDGDHGFALTLVPATGRLVALVERGSHWRLDGIDPVTGRVAWQRELTARRRDDDPFPPLFVAGDTVLVAGAIVERVRAGDGAALGTVVPLVIRDPAPRATWVSGRLLLWNDRQVELLDPAAGRTQWAAADSTSPALLVTADTSGVLRVGARGMELLRWTTGERAWRQDLGGPVASEVGRHGDLILITTDTALVALERATGRPRFVAPFPAAFAAGAPTHARAIGLPDQLLTRGDRIVVAREQGGVMAFAAADGRRLWQQPPMPRPDSAHDYVADARYTMYVAGMRRADRRVPTGLPTLSAGTAGSFASHADLLLATAQRHYEDAQRRVELARAGGDRGALAVAQQQQVTAAQAQVITTQIDMVSGQMSATAQLAGAALGMVNALIGMQKDAHAFRADHLLQTSYWYHQRSFQARYHLRPFFWRGRGLAITDLDSGRRRQLVYAPLNDYLQEDMPDVPAYDISPRGRWLAVFGLGIRADHYTPVRYRPMDADHPSRRATMDVPLQAVLVYDLDSLTFDDAPLPAEPALAEAIRAGDAALVDQLLARPAVSVDTRHWAAGETALMYATAHGRLDLVRRLIELGADVNAVSDRGESALDLATTDDVRNYLRSRGGRPGPELRQ